MSGFQMADYNDVASRIKEFREKFPTGSLQPADPTKPFHVVQIGERNFIAYAAAAYRTPDDPRPGIAVAYEPVPGPTSFTKDSELQNAETAAWGRAIVAALAADTKKGIASAEEMRSKGDASQSARPSATGEVSEAQLKYLNTLLGKTDLQTRDQKHGYVMGIIGREIESSKELTKAEASKVIEILVEEVGDAA